MSHHDHLALAAPRPHAAAAPRPHAAEDAAGFLLDQCRRLAGARYSGEALPADLALRELRAVLPGPDAYRVFGLLHELVGMVVRAGTGADRFQWFPVGAAWRSADEAWLLGSTLTRIAAGEEPPAAPPRPDAPMALASTYCAVADTMCSLFTAEGRPCRQGCPFLRARAEAALAGGGERA